MAQRTASAPRVPHRVLDPRRSFTARPRSKWRAHAAVRLLVASCAQLLIWVGHLVWVGELRLVRWVFP